jgi:hypothetical protein
MLLPFLIACSLFSIVGGVEPEDDTVVSEWTKVLGQQTLQELTSVSPDGTTFIFQETTADLQELEPGDVIVGGVSDITPHGFLREVVAISDAAGQVAIETTQATLEDVFENATLTFERTLTPRDISNSTHLDGATLKMASPLQLDDEFVIDLDDVVLLDVDGDSGTTYDQVVANGSIRISPRIELEGQIRGFHLQYFSFVATAEEELEIEIIGDIFSAGIQKNIEISRYVMAPFTILVGPVPVIITPVLAFNVGLDGSVSVGIRSAVSQTASLSVGLIYENENWRPTSDLLNDYQFDSPQVVSECALKVYAGPELEVMLYGVVTPQLHIHGYGELLADPFTNPWWELYAGIEAEMGVDVKILSKLIASYHASFFDERTLLASSTDPTVSGDPTEPIGFDAFAQSLKEAIECADFDAMGRLMCKADDPSLDFWYGIYMFEGFPSSSQEALDNMSDWNFTSVSVDISDLAETIYESLVEPVPEFQGPIILVEDWADGDDNYLLEVLEKDGEYCWSGMLLYTNTQTPFGVVPPPMTEWDFSDLSIFVRVMDWALNNQRIDVLVDMASDPVFAYGCATLCWGPEDADAGVMFENLYENVELFNQGGFYYSRLEPHERTDPLDASLSMLEREPGLLVYQKGGMDGAYSVTLGISFSGGVYLLTDIFMPSIQ